MHLNNTSLNHGESAYSETPVCQIRSLDDTNSLRQCVDIQRQIWAYSAEDLWPLRSFLVCRRIGGQVLGALDQNGSVIGFLTAFPAVREGTVYLHSQLMGVLPEYQGLGIGRKLKLAQREEALSRNIHYVEWTFDPTEVRNAYLNIERLGAICRRYSANEYGITSSPLHGGMPTDRLIAEWHLSSSRVQATANGKPLLEVSSAQRLAVEIPLEIGQLKSSNPEVAVKLLQELRHQMVDLLAKNYCVTGFQIDRERAKAQYLLEPFPTAAI